MAKRNDKGLVDDLTDENPDMDMNEDTYGEKGGRTADKTRKEKDEFGEEDEIMEEDDDLDLEEDL